MNKDPEWPSFLLLWKMEEFVIQTLYNLKLSFCFNPEIKYKMFFWEIEKQKGARLGPRRAHLGWDLVQMKHNLSPDPLEALPGPFWALFGSKNPKNHENEKIQKNSEIWNPVMFTQLVTELVAP